MVRTMTCMKACLGWNHWSSRIPLGTAAIRYLWSVNGFRARGGKQRERDRERERERGEKEIERERGGGDEAREQLYKDTTMYNIKRKSKGIMRQHQKLQFFLNHRSVSGTLSDVPILTSSSATSACTIHTTRTV